MRKQALMNAFSSKGSTDKPVSIKNGLLTAVECFFSVTTDIFSSLVVNKQSKYFRIKADELTDWFVRTIQLVNELQREEYCWIVAGVYVPHNIVVTSGPYSGSHFASRMSIKRNGSLYTALT